MHYESNVLKFISMSSGHAPPGAKVHGGNRMGKNPRTACKSYSEHVAEERNEVIAVGTVECAFSHDHVSWCRMGFQFGMLERENIGKTFLDLALLFPSSYSRS